MLRPERITEALKSYRMTAKSSGFLVIMLSFGCKLLAHSLYELQEPFCGSQATLKESSIILGHQLRKYNSIRSPLESREFMREVVGKAGMLLKFNSPQELHRFEAS